MNMEMRRWEHGMMYEIWGSHGGGMWRRVVWCIATNISILRTSDGPQQVPAYQAESCTKVSGEYAASIFRDKNKKGIQAVGSSKCW
jgi:hypothetical protein